MVADCLSCDGERRERSGTPRQARSVSAPGRSSTSTRWPSTSSYRSQTARSPTSRTEQIATEAALDGFYVIRTTSQHPTLTSPAVVRAYKQLKMAERAFRTIKETLEIRPIN